VKSSAQSGAIIEGEYIVILNDNNSTARIAATEREQVTDFSEQLLAKNGINDNALESTFVGMTARGFVAQLSEEEAITLQKDASIALIEPDRVVSVCACVDVIAPTSVTWSVRKTGFGNGLNFQTKTAWIIDTGIDLDHPDLSVDTQRSKSFVTGQTSADDNNGHGTHVAGIIGAVNNRIGLIGVASGVKLVALKVLNQLGEGRLSGVISAVTHVSQNGVAGDVVNMSLGMDGISATLDREVQAAANKGILFAIAAGNDNKPARDFSPARVNHANVFTVSAIDSTGTFASFSN
jgi:subtilisin family serine protease